MKYFVHLKDDVVFACHESSTEVDIPGDNIIEVQSNGEQFIGKKYANGQFIDAEEIKYAVLDVDNDNTVIGIEKTLYSSDVKGPIITDNSVKVLWKWNGTSFVAPNTVQKLETIVVNSMEVTTSQSMVAQTAEDLITNAALNAPIVPEEQIV